MDEPSAAHKRSFRRRVRSVAGTLPVIAGVLVAGALFWATYRRFVRPSRGNEGSRDRRHSACGE